MKNNIFDEKTFVEFCKWYYSFDSAGTRTFDSADELFEDCASMVSDYFGAYEGEFESLADYFKCIHKDQLENLPDCIVDNINWDKVVEHCNSTPWDGEYNIINGKFFLKL